MMVTEFDSPILYCEKYYLKLKLILKNLVKFHL